MASVRDTLGFLAVVASLVFVGLEIRQNTALARAATRQALTDSSIETILAVATDNELGGQLDRWVSGSRRGTEECPDDLRQICRWVRAQLRIQENAFLQFQDGVIDESVFFSYGWQDNVIFQSPFFPPWWRSIRGNHHPEFVAAFEAEYNLGP